ncbi:phosphoribosylamine--glycine ligase [Caldicoprobacter algeriensis]|uniref:phosphoribosylamine--glycine ligase n=1 Tax=Caldicoprobacter algeriensis TaxID=699281 RepID=UPI00207A3579|nr:phosphoribosylamine--glycine ligase [Caldicoprobacter algeriensis]MCM8899991.1 phosphoribosylamine--glycine ligase [Caldicoprobacter algeriensis]
MRILVVGGGGREHALVWKISQSSKVSKIYCAPGNGGISELAECVNIPATDVEGVVRFAKQNHIDLTVVAPDDPLAMGMVDALQAEGLRAFGPTKDAAMIESSKVFAKNLMQKYGIPTAKYKVFDDYGQAVKYVEQIEYPTVIKAEGLALGKGVVIVNDVYEAKEALKAMMVDKVFGQAGLRVVIEEHLIGSEVSVLAFTDGRTVIPMVSAQDHKRAYDGDRGPNTGGMGAFSPSRVYTPEIAREVENRIIKPTIKAMAEEGRPFKGVLYFGLMLTEHGPRVLEYNARFGDPETQVVLPRLKTDIVDIFEAVIDERLDKINIEWEDNAAVCVVLASGGYPKSYKTGYEISGIEEVLKEPDIMVFHAGTKRIDGKYYTSGGRVLGVTAIAKDLDTAIQKVYQNVEKIHFENMHYRRDIGRK